MPGRKLQGWNDFSSTKEENVAKGFWQRSHCCQVGAPPECKERSQWCAVRDASTRLPLGPSFPSSCIFLTMTDYFWQGINFICRFCSLAWYKSLLARCDIETSCQPVQCSINSGCDAAGQFWDTPRRFCSPKLCLFQASKGQGSRGGGGGGGPQ